MVIRDFSRYVIGLEVTVSIVTAILSMQQPIRKTTGNLQRWVVADIRLEQLFWSILLQVCTVEFTFLVLTRFKDLSAKEGMVFTVLSTIQVSSIDSY